VTANVQSPGTAKRRMVEIARAVRLKAKIVIFDEPIATLTPAEKHDLFAMIDRLRVWCFFRRRNPRAET
jgi:simple sugar transport system ATP-binding protein